MISVELADGISIKEIIETTIWHLHSSKKIQGLLHGIVHVESTIALTERGYVWFGFLLWFSWFWVF